MSSLWLAERWAKILYPLEEQAFAEFMALD